MLVNSSASCRYTAHAKSSAIFFISLICSDSPRPILVAAIRMTPHTLTGGTRARFVLCDEADLAAHGADDVRNLPARRLRDVEEIGARLAIRKAPEFDHADL